MELLTLIQSGGPAYLLAAVFAYLYLQERGDRKAAEAKLIELYQDISDRVVTAVNNGAQAARDMNTALVSVNSTIQNLVYRIRDRPDDT